VVIRNIPQRRTLRISEFERKVVALDDQVQAILKSGEHIVFVDEAVFSARSYQDLKAWSGVAENVVVEDRCYSHPCLAVCAAVCKCHGLLTFEVRDYSFNGKAFGEFLG
jgi:hypothetical protein